MATTNDDKKAQGGNGPALNRRQALARLGLGISIAYATPMQLGLREARAHGGSGGGSGGHGGNPGSGGNSGPSHGHQSGPTDPSAPTSPSGPDDDASGPSGPNDDPILLPGSGQP